VTMISCRASPELAVAAGGAATCACTAVPQIATLMATALRTAFVIPIPILFLPSRNLVL
jgi:hypothetical protein